LNIDYICYRSFTQLDTLIGLINSAETDRISS